MLAKCTWGIIPSKLLVRHYSGKTLLYSRTNGPSYERLSREFLLRISVFKGFPSHLIYCEVQSLRTPRAWFYVLGWIIVKARRRKIAIKWCIIVNLRLYNIRVKFWWFIYLAHRWYPRTSNNASSVNIYRDVDFRHKSESSQCQRYNRKFLKRTYFYRHTAGKSRFVWISF